MQTMKISYLVLFTGILMLMSCDPGHSGNSYINTQSSYELRLNYNSHYSDTTMFIQPNSLVVFYRFGNIGAGNEYDCCPCEFQTITLQPTDTSKHLIKVITNTNNWIMINPNTKRFDNKDITCEFFITQSDIQ